MTATTHSVRAATSARSSSLSLQNDRLFYTAVLLSIVPLWFGAYLPMVDLPGHAAVIAALEQLSAGNPTFTEVFETDWFTPYLFGYAVFYGLALLLPVTITMKLVISVSLAAIPILTGVLLRTAGADSRWRWLAIPGSYSFAFYWGFLSYVAALPFALWLLICTVRYEQQTSVRNASIVAAVAVLLFFSHVIAMGFACLLALVYLAGGNYQHPRRLLALWLPYTAPLPLIAAWLLPRLATEAGVADAPVVYGSVAARLATLVSQPAGLDAFSWVAVGVTGAIVALPWLAGAKLSRHAARWLPFAVALAVFLLTPSFAVQTAFFYERLGVFLVPLWLLMWDAPTTVRRVDWVAMPVVVLWVLANTARFAAFARETDSFDAVMEQMEPGKRVASMIVEPSTPLFATPVYLHFSSWYQARKHGVVDFNFADFRLVLLRRDRAQARLDESLAWYPWLFDWERNGGSNYDYFLVKSSQDFSREIFKDRLESVALVSRSGWWWLYENVSRASDDE